MYNICYISVYLYCCKMKKLYFLKIFFKRIMCINNVICSILYLYFKYSEDFKFLKW